MVQFDGTKIEERLQALSRRITRLADRGLAEAKQTIEGVGSAAEAQVASVAELLARSTRVAKTALEGPLATEWNGFLISAVEAARAGTKRWITVASDMLASTRRLAADVLDRGA